MLDAYIIDRLRREKEEEVSRWQPLPLEIPIPEDTGEEDPQRKKEAPQDPREIRIQFESFL